MNTNPPTPTTHEPDRGCVARPAAARGHIVASEPLTAPVHDHDSKKSDPNRNPNLPSHSDPSDLPIPTPTLDTIITTVANFYRIHPSLARGARRDRKAAWPRQVAMTLCCEFSPHLTIRAIAVAFHRNHSTVVHARRCVIAAQRNPTARAHLAQLRKLIRSTLM